MKYGPMNKWRDEVDALCRKFGAEPIIAEGTNQEVKRLIIVSPKELSNEEQTSLARCIPTVVAVEFKVQAITDWKNLLNITCAKYNVEPVISKRNATSDAIQSLQFNCPRELTADERTAIIAPIPALNTAK